MGTLYDYISWRGDLSFREAPINEVDSLIFSLLSYIDFKDIVPEEHDGNPISIKMAATAFFAKNPDPRKVSMGVIVPKEIITVFQKIKNTRRFQKVMMKAHVNLIDTKKEMQFSATTFLPGDGTVLVAYRGTDDTLVGWKEDFNMSFMSVVPAQEEAANYLNQVALHAKGAIRLTGHSKGGNLAVYAAVHCQTDTQKRLLKVWCNDGPGFGSSMLNDPNYVKIRSIIRTLVPQSSVVGMLLEHDENYTVVKSRQAGLFQHNALSWDVMGGSFVRLKNITGESQRFNRTLNEWIKQMTPEQREQFVESLYQILSSDNAMTLTDLVSITKNKWIQKSSTLDPQVRQTIQKTLSVLLEMNTKSILKDWFSKK